MTQTQEVEQAFQAKLAAAREALHFVEKGMVVGLGSGSTAEIFIELLANQKLDIGCVASSNRSAAIAQRLGLQVLDNLAWREIDLTIDGADEIDPQLHLIKGLGGALLKEKILATFSKKFIVIADESKRVEQLGARTAVPVEVSHLGREASRYRLAQYVGDIDDVRLRCDKANKIFKTDGGNYIYDCHFGRLADARKTAGQLAAQSFILCHGLFLGLAHGALIGTASGGVEHVGL